MGRNNKFPLPPECDEQGAPHPTSGHSNIGLFDYFTAMDNLAEQKNISPENAEFSLRAYHLREAVGGRIHNATTAFRQYVEFMQNTPEEVRQLQIPSAIRSTVDDLISYLTWYYRLSFQSIDTEEKNKKDAQIAELISENAPLKEKIAALSLKEVSLLSENQQQATEVTRLSEELKHAVARIETLKNGYDQQTALLREAEQSKTYSEQICSDLRMQLSEKKEEFSRLLQRNETLDTENKKQQAAISDLSHELDVSRTRYEAATSLATKQSENISALEMQLAERDEKQSDMAVRYAELERQLTETKTALETVTASDNESRTALITCRSELTDAQTAIIQVNAQLIAERTISDSLRETVSQLAGGSTKQTTKSRTSRKKPTDTLSKK